MTNPRSINPRYNQNWTLRAVILSFLAVILLLAPLITAQESGDDDDHNDGGTKSIKDLGCRSKIVLERLGKEAHPIHIGITLDSGLGVFDAFFASLCMILVSEIIC